MKIQFSIHDNQPGKNPLFRLALLDSAEQTKKIHAIRVQKIYSKQFK